MAHSHSRNAEYLFVAQGHVPMLVQFVVVWIIDRSSGYIRLALASESVSATTAQQQLESKRLLRHEEKTTIVCAACQGLPLACVQTGLIASSEDYFFSGTKEVAKSVLI